MTVLAWVCLATSIYAASLVPFLLLIDADHFTPAWLRATPAATTATLRTVPLTAAALLLIRGGTTHA